MNTQQILLTCKLRLRFWISIQATTVLQCTFSSTSSLNTAVPISNCLLIARFSISIVKSTISSHFSMNFFIKSKICLRFHKEISVWDFAASIIFYDSKRAVLYAANGDFSSNACRKLKTISIKNCQDGIRAQMVLKRISKKQMA